MGDMSDAEEKTAALLAALWVKVRPMVEERLALLEAAAAAAASGALGEAQRAEAGGAAHKLAGSLGMYGYDEGTAVARKIEVLLGDAAPDAGRLRELNAELRRAVFPQG
jgi:HPt (histidine-containing phosphotransfer) domain-containing protein